MPTLKKAYNLKNKLSALKKRLIRIVKIVGKDKRKEILFQVKFQEIKKNLNKQNKN
jgi:hypothetical protein